MRHLPWILVGLTLVFVVGCHGNTAPRDPCERELSMGCDTSGFPLRLDRGDWLVNKQTAVWRVLEEISGALPVHRGYMVAKDYKQMRGGPAYRVYTVTTTNRREEIGRVDQLGRGYRYEPDRNAGFFEVDVGVGTLQESVGAIFETSNVITLEKTTERRIAFDLLDKNGNGELEEAEVGIHGDMIGRGDRNADGMLDFPEFDALERL